MSKDVKLDYFYVDDEQLDIGFNCGDLWLRNDVDLTKDIKQCVPIIQDKANSIFETEKLSTTLKTSNKGIKEFAWCMRYTIPTIDQIKNNKKGQKYEIKKYNWHTFRPMYLTTYKDLEVHKSILKMDIAFLTNCIMSININYINQITFNQCLLTDGFLDDFKNDLDKLFSEDYIVDNLGQKKWFTSPDLYLEKGEVLDKDPEELSLEDPPYIWGNDLDYISYIRARIDTKIKFNFAGENKSFLEILKHYNLT